MSNATPIKETGRMSKRTVADVLFYGKSMVPALTLLLVILVLFFSLFTKNFFTLGTFKAISSNFPVIAIVAIGMTFVLLVGGLDLSVGSILGFTAVNVVLFHDVFEKAGIPLAYLPWLVVLCSLVIGVALGLINGLIITRIGINPVITTLGTMALARGMASWFALGFEILKTGRITDQAFLNMARVYLPDAKTAIIPITLVYLVVLYALAIFILKFTRYGRNVYAVGANEYAARLAGINVRRIKFASYIISGAMAGLAGAILVAQLSLGRDDAGLGIELEVITAAVLGGVSMAGGKGNLFGVIIAVIILGVIRNGMVQLQATIGLSYYWREVVKGLILILAISIDAARIMATKRRQVVRQ
jgi:ribose/xylose/arabinose/galactoside ABC-type transport system permease subunit